jgi:hypothetical protein
MVRVSVEKDRLSVVLFVSVINFYITPRSTSRAFADVNLIAIGRDKAGSQAKTCKH